MALNHTKSVTAHKNSIKRNLKYVYVYFKQGNVLYKGEIKS